MIDEEAIRIAVLSAHIDEVDYYALLEIARDADPAAVRDAFHQFALRFHPDQHTDDRGRMRQALAIFKRGTEAYRVLMNPGLRARYDAALDQGARRLAADAMQLPRGTADHEVLDVSPAARPFFERAREALARGDLPGARMHIALARSRGAGAAIERLAARIDASVDRPR